MTPNKRKRLICGVGINDADYNVYISEMVDGKQKAIWICPFYMKWRSMITRCYSQSSILRHPSYAECSSVPEWHRFSNFKAWMEQQDWEGKDLDKDILISGNKVYSPETCVFVDPRVNTFMLECSTTRGEYPIGVCLDKRVKRKPYRAFCNSVITKKTEHLGRYSTPEEAHSAWLAFKLEQAYILAAEQTDERVAKALIDRYENYKGDHLNADL